MQQFFQLKVMVRNKQKISINVTIEERKREITYKGKKRRIKRKNMTSTKKNENYEKKREMVCKRRMSL